MTGGSTQAVAKHYLIVNRADATLDDIPLKDLRSGRTRMAARRP